VSSAEQDVLANATIVANDVVLRQAWPEYGEDKPLVCGLQFAFAAQMAKYFQHEKEGHWYIPLLHPDKESADLQTVNRIANRIKDLHRAVTEGRVNLAYTVSKPEATRE
jgi:hypothetical protein